MNTKTLLLLIASLVLFFIVGMLCYLESSMQYIDIHSGKIKKVTTSLLGYEKNSSIEDSRFSIIVSQFIRPVEPEWKIATAQPNGLYSLLWREQYPNYVYGQAAALLDQWAILVQLEPNWDTPEAIQEEALILLGYIQNGDVVKLTEVVYHRHRASLSRTVVAPAGGTGEGR